LPFAVIVFGVPDESTNVLPVPSAWSSRVTLLNRESDPGLTELLAVLYAPVPIPLIAATRKIYAVPLVSPVTVAVVAVEVPSVNVVQVDPELLLNWTA
jgi:hypothetical protein